MVGESQEAVGAAPGASGAAGGSKTPTLEEFGSDLTKQAEEAKLDPCIGRENEIVRVTQILGRRTKNNPCLIGEPGVGKSAIAEGLAQNIAAGDVPETLEGKRMMTLDMGLLVAGTKYRGEFEERLKKLMDEVKADDDIILFIDEVCIPPPTFKHLQTLYFLTLQLTPSVPAAQTPSLEHKYHSYTLYPTSNTLHYPHPNLLNLLPYTLHPKPFL
jgi:hypothetical protein